MTIAQSLAWSSALLLLLLCLGTPLRAEAQGCIAVRHSPNTSQLGGSCVGCALGAKDRIASVAYRWFRSDRDFSGDEEQSQFRDNDPIANEVHMVDLSLAFGLTDHWSVALSLPFVSSDRTTKYEHDGVHRYTMSAAGMGDLRMLANYWWFDPHSYMEGNVALGFGIKAPTGDDDATDLVHRRSGVKRRPVDQSIQPGDGGWGLLLELQAFHKLHDDLFGYLSGSYMMTPEEENDTQHTVTDLLEVPSVLRFNSIPDQYLARSGLTYALWPEYGVTLSLGARVEGIPVHDAIGGSYGFRRPGYAVSIEPGASWTYASSVLSLSIPAAIYRNRQRSAAEDAADYPAGRATFADFVVMTSFAYRF